MSMLLKSLSSNKLLFVGVAVLLLAASIFSFSVSAQEEETSSSDIRFFLQFLNTGCTEAGETRATYSVQSGLDANGILVKSPSANPDCVKIGLQRDPPIQEGSNYPSSFTMNTDFRICARGVDNISGGSWNQEGPHTCTPWASQVVGTSGKATISDLDKTDPDGTILFVETRALPESTSIDNVRVGVSASDNQCSTQLGAVKWTGWASSLASGGQPSFSDIATDTDGSDFDCFNIHIESASSNICTDSEGPILKPSIYINSNSCEDGGYVNPNGGRSAEELNEGGANLCFKNTGSGDKICLNEDGFITTVTLKNEGPSPDRYFTHAGCQVIKNIRKEGGLRIFVPDKITAPEGMITEAACNERGCAGVYTCPENYAIRGINFVNPPGSDNDDYENYLICEPLRDGVTIDHNREIFRPNAGCGQGRCSSIANAYGDYEPPHWLNPSFQEGDAWVATGAIYNNGTNGRHIRGMLYAPVESSDVAVRACNLDEEPPQCSDGIDNDGDGTIDYPADLECSSPNDGSESSSDDDGAQINCTFTANPASLAKDSAGNVIGASTLSWECRDEASGDLGANVVKITEDNEEQDFNGLGSNLSALGETLVSPTKTTRFVLEYPGFAPEMVEVRVTDTSFDEDIP